MTESAKADRPSVTLMIPALNEEESAPLVSSRLAAIVSENPGFDFDVIVVDDGSTDRTSEVFSRELQAAELRFLVLQLSRNFGSHAAISAAVDNCASDAAITLSADLQEPTSLVTDFLRAWKAGNEVVWAVREKRADAGRSETGAARGFSKFFSDNSEIPNYPPAGPSQMLLSRRVIDALRELREGNQNILGLVAWLGFPQTTIVFEQESRAVGKSRWNNAKRAKLAVDSFVAHSRAPLRVVLMSALGVAGIAVLLWVATIAALILSAPAGLMAVSALICSLAAVQLAALCVVGAYVWRGGYDARRRPVYVVARRWSGSEQT
jgi:dolichol-phosphate mannosyltransferase